MWAKFQSIEDFESWHSNIKTILGYPLADGITINYTQSAINEFGEIVAWVDDEHSEGLIQGIAPKLQSIDKLGV